MPRVFSACGACARARPLRLQARPHGAGAAGRGHPLQPGRAGAAERQHPGGAERVPARRGAGPGLRRGAQRAGDRSCTCPSSGCDGGHRALQEGARAPPRLLRGEGRTWPTCTWTRGSYDEAIKLYEQALNDMLYATPYIAQGNLGWALYKKGDDGEGAGEHQGRGDRSTPSSAWATATWASSTTSGQDAKTPAGSSANYREKCPESRRPTCARACAWRSRATGGRRQAAPRDVRRPRPPSRALKEECRSLRGAPVGPGSRRGPRRLRPIPHPAARAARACRARRLPGDADPAEPRCTRWRTGQVGAAARPASSCSTTSGPTRR